MHQHFTQDDIIGVVLGTVLLAPFLILPGYMLGWLCDLLAFRRQSLAWRLLYSLVFSVSVAPVLIFLLGTFVSDRAVWAFYALSMAVALASRFLLRSSTPKSNFPRWVLLAMFGWAVIVWLSGIDLQFGGDRLYPPVFAYDLNLRTEVIHGLALRGLPAVNPLFFPGHTVPLRYHYFWLLPCALVERASGGWVNSRQSLVAADVWCGWALMAVAVLYLRFFHPAGERNLSGRAKWGIGLLAVAGLDILPNLFLYVANRLTGAWFVYSSAEWWNTPVTGFPHAVFFEAHHVAGLIACLAGFLLLWRANDGGRTHWPSVVCAGLCFASAAGTSVYVAFTFALFLAGWGAIRLVRGNWRERAAWIVSGATAAVCAAAYLRSLRDAGGSGGQFLLPTVRSFAPFDTVMPSFGFSWNQIAIANFLVLPLNYFLETGVWFILAVLWVSRAMRRGRRRSKANQAALMMLTVSLLVGTFLRSGVINNNDLGWRSVLVAQFILLIWSVDPMRAWWRRRARLAKAVAEQKPKVRSKMRVLSPWYFRTAVLLSLGIASTAYDFIWMRFYIPMSDSGAVPVAKWFGHDHTQGARTFAVRKIYSELNPLIPGLSVVQSNPNYWNDVYHGLYGLHQTASFDYSCGSTMGGDPRDCERMQKELIPLFNDPTVSESFDIDRVCKAWGISVLVAKDDDPVFHDHESWPWKRDPLAQNERVRAIPCGALLR